MPHDNATPNEHTQKTRARRKRQRERERLAISNLEGQVGKLRGERDRARRDRVVMAAMLEQLVPEVAVNREKSGRWFVAQQQGGARVLSAAELVAQDGFDGVLDVLRVISRRSGWEPDQATLTRWLEAITALSDQRFVVTVERLTRIDVERGGASARMVPIESIDA